MNKNEFLSVMKNNLLNIPKDEVDDIIYDYEEHFRVGLDNGKSEELIANELGDPRKIVKHFNLDKKIEDAEKNLSFKNVFQILFYNALKGVKNFFMVIVFSILLIAFGISFYILGASMILTGFIGVFVVLFSSFIEYIELGINIVTAECLMLILICLGILILIGNHNIIKKFLYFVVKYFKKAVK